MDWHESEDQGIPIIHLEGEIDLEWSPDLRKILQSKLRKKCQCLVLDLGGVSYIDSSGLATIVEYIRDAGKFSGKIALANMQETVRTVFHMVRLNEIIPYYSTVAEARDAVRKA
jgi:anti-sigma B factor antagonist